MEDNSKIKDAMELIKQAREKFLEAGLDPNIDIWFHDTRNQIKTNDALGIGQKIKEELGSGVRDIGENFIRIENRQLKIETYITHR